MRTSLTLLALILAVLLPATLVSAHAEEHFVLQRGESGSYTSEPVPGGINPLYFEQAPGVGGDEICTHDVDTYCEYFLAELVNPVEDDGDPATNVTARRSLSIDLSTTAADYDIILYESDADATVGAELGRSTEFPTGDTSESVYTYITTSEEEDRQFVVLEVIHFAPATPFTLDLHF